jgi:hypothetical protein
MLTEQGFKIKVFRHLNYSEIAHKFFLFLTTTNYTNVGGCSLNLPLHGPVPGLESPCS